MELGDWLLDKVMIKAIRWLDSDRNVTMFDEQL